MPPPTPAAAADPAQDELDPESGLTELTKLEATRVDGVGSPANGIGFLLFKALPAPDTDDPDTAMGTGGCGCCGACKCTGPGEPQCACCPDCKCPDTGVGQPPAPGMMTKAALDAISAQEEAWLAEILPGDLAKASRFVSAAVRRKQAKGGTALPDGSYPMGDSDLVRRAGILIRSKKGKWQAARRLMMRLGHGDPLGKKKGTTVGKASATQYPGDAGGSAAAAMVAPGPLAGATKPAKPRKKKKRNTGGDNSVAAQTQVALKEALGYDPAEMGQRLAKAAGDAAASEVAKALGRLPAPGGPVTSVPRSATVKTEAREELLAKAAQFRQIADDHSDRGEAQNYRDMAREAEEAAAKMGAPAR